MGVGQGNAGLVFVEILRLELGLAAFEPSGKSHPANTFIPRLTHYIRHKSKNLKKSI